MKKYFLLSVLFLLIFCPFSVHAQKAETGSVNINVEGSAKIKRDDVATARDEAIQNALERAILESASQLSEIPIKNEDFHLIKNIIVQEPDKYVLYYTITEEIRQPQDFVVKANVVVALLALKNDLQKMGFLHNNLVEKNDIKIFLTVKGLKSYSGYLRIRDFLQSRIRLVKSIYPAHFSSQEAQFQIDIIGNAQSLVEELEKNAGCE